MRSEIGSEFWDIPLGEANNIFSPNTQWFISGRSALKAIIEDNDFHTAAIPYWCCDSMVKPFVESGVEVVFYGKDWVEADAILVMDYFGYSTDKTYNDYPGIVIRDVTHSLFSKAYGDADYTFGSLRKWAGFLTGGFAIGLKKNVEYSKSQFDNYVALRQEAMSMKKAYMTGVSNSKEYLDLFNRAEVVLENIGIVEADERDVKMARYLDTAAIKSIRRENAAILMAAFKDWLVFPTLKDNDCPLFVPIRVENRNELRKYLIQNEVYCPVHWPMSSYHRLSAKQRQFYESEISLVCDQRYSVADMKRVIALINEFEKAGGRL